MDDLDQSDIPPSFRHPLSTEQLDAARVMASRGGLRGEVEHALARHLLRALDEIERQREVIEQAQRPAEAAMEVDRG